jgi:uncharacterized protein (DUF58 family)
VITPSPQPSPPTDWGRGFGARIRRIEIATKRAVQDRLQGQYHSVFKGRGMAFAEVRAYVPGDEVRAIDWNVTARTGHLHVKRFEEERELTVVILCDGSGSTDFGSAGRTKAEVAAEIAALLAFSAVANGDRVGLVLFTDRVERFVPPRKGRSHALRLVSEILRFRPEGRATSLAAPLEFLRRALKRSAVAFLLSDFVEPPAREGDPWPFERALRIAARKHDLVPIRLSDRAEAEPPAAGLAWLEDPETGEAFRVDLSDRAARRRLADALRAEGQRLDRLFARLDLDAARVRADDADYVTPLAAFFQARARRHG